MQRKWIGAGLAYNFVYKGCTFILVSNYKLELVIMIDAGIWWIVGIGETNFYSLRTILQFLWY